MRPVNEPIAVSVVVASHARHLRLRWLLNALAEQSYEGKWEAVVVHDYEPQLAERVIEQHPLAESGVLRHIAIEPGTGSPARQRNIGWRTGRGELVAFTDDDCRPERDWLASLVEAAHTHERSVVQGATRPDPLEEGVLAAPHVRTMWIEPVNAFRQTCNILYPRALLEELDGFDERAITGEDVDLSLRAVASGRQIVAAPDAVVYHAIESHTLPGILRENLKWRHLAYLAKRHPELRQEFKLGVFWDSEHMLVTAAAVGVIAGRRFPPLLALTVPYLRLLSRRRGNGWRRRLVATVEMPGQATRQVGEVLGLAAGSVRHGTLLL